MKHALFLLLVLIPGVTALTPLEAGVMEAKVLTTNTISFNPESSRFVVTEATGRLSWYPRDDALQDVLSLETSPEAKQTQNALVFEWTRPGRTEDLSVTAKVKTRNSIVPVRKKIPFPLRSVPSEIEPYLGTGAIVDQTPSIQKLAQELAAGKNDAYEVVFALADWTTTNVEYSLASLGQPAIQTASQVLESRWGKCDELTALFISLNRALGIPARFVAGYSYTNSDLLQQEWGGHGWAEVWLPDVGWIPFDVTYGEYGYLDAGHIRLKVSADAKETSIDYSARGTGFTLQTEPLSIYVTPTEMAGNYDDRISITLDAPYTNVGIGSAVLILATIKNKKDYYVASRLDLAQTTNTEMLSKNYKNVLLKPWQTVTVPFLVKIDSNLDRGYRYEFPFKLYTRLGQEEKIDITVEPSNPVYDADDFDDIIETYTSVQTTGAPFGVTCDRSTAYTGETHTHTCNVQGTVGETVEVCDEKRVCTTESAERFTIGTSYDAPGIHTSVYTARTMGKTTTFFVTSRNVETSKVNIDVSHPTSTTPDESITVTLVLNHTGADPKDVKVTLDTPYASGTEAIADLSASAQVRFQLPGRAFRPGANEMSVRVAFTDELGTAGTASASSTIQLTGVRFTDRIYFFFQDFGQMFS